LNETTSTLRAFPGPERIAGERAVDVRLPPLAADAAWREGLAMLLDMCAPCASLAARRALSLEGIEGGGRPGQGRSGELRPGSTGRQAGWARHAPNPLLLISSGAT
jgi:hypothetical protein